MWNRQKNHQSSQSVAWLLRPPVLNQEPPGTAVVGCVDASVKHGARSPDDRRSTTYLPAAALLGFALLGGCGHEHGATGRHGRCDRIGGCRSGRRRGWRWRRRGRQRSRKKPTRANNRPTSCWGAGPGADASPPRPVYFAPEEGSARTHHGFNGRHGNIFRTSYISPPQSPPRRCCPHAVTTWSSAPPPAPRPASSSPAQSARLLAQPSAQSSTPLKKTARRNSRHHYRVSARAPPTAAPRG